MKPTIQAGLKNLRELLNEAEGLGVDVSGLIKRDTIDIAVVGVIKRGKSTFLNALLGEKVLPSRAIVCTSAVTVLEHSDKPSIEIVFRDGQQKMLDYSKIKDGKGIFDTLMRWVGRSVATDQGMSVEEQAGISEVRVGYPNTYAVEGVRIVDTPGVEDTDEWREEITFKYVQTCDAVIMLLDSQSPFVKSEKEFLRDKIQKRIRERVVFVVNKADQIESTDVPKVVERIKVLASDLVPNPRIFPLSSKNALEHQVKNTKADQGFKAFESFFSGYLLKGRAGHLLASRYLELSDRVNEQLGALRLRLSDYDKKSERILFEIEEQRKTNERLSEKFEGLKLKVNDSFGKYEQLLKEEMGKNIPDGLCDFSVDHRTKFYHMRRDMIEALEKKQEELKSRLEELVGEYFEDASPWRGRSLAISRLPEDFSTPKPGLAGRFFTWLFSLGGESARDDYMREVSDYLSSMRNQTDRMIVDYMMQLRKEVTDHLEIKVKQYLKRELDLMRERTAAMNGEAQNAEISREKLAKEMARLEGLSKKIGVEVAVYAQ